MLRKVSGPNREAVTGSWRKIDTGVSWYVYLAKSLKLLNKGKHEMGDTCSMYGKEAKSIKKSQ